MIIKSYTELITLPTFNERFEYLKQGNMVGEDTFGNQRYLNQIFYKSPEWRRTRRVVILRDNGNDMGMKGYPIHGPIYIHHINAITIEDILERRPILFDLDNLISVSFDIHQALTYSDNSILSSMTPVDRTPYDTCPWRK